MIHCEIVRAEIVCAHYTENLAWLNLLRNHVTVYHKGPRAAYDPGFKAWICLANVGRAAHTYLTFIIDRYDNLPEYTVFVQGNDSFGSDNSTINLICEMYKSPKLLTMAGPFTHSGKWADPERRHAKMAPASESFDQFYRRLFGHDRPARIKWFMSGPFTAHRKQILGRPREFYERARQTLEHHRNPEQSYYMDRLWYTMFN